MTSGSVVVNIPHDMGNKVAKLVQMACEFNSRIHLSCQNKKVNAKSIMGMISMTFGNGDTVTIEADGSDEEDAVKAISKYLSQK